MPVAQFFRQWLLLVSALLILAGTVGWKLFAEYSFISEQQQERLVAQTQVIDKNLELQLTATNHAIDSIRRDLPTLKAVQDGLARLNHRLEFMRGSMPTTRAITLFDADGTLIARSPNGFVGQNFKTRGYFQVARQGGDHERLYIAPPFLAKTGEYVLNVSKVLLDESGKFDGVILVSLGPEYFKTLLTSVLYALDMRSTLVHGDGKIIYSAPEPEGDSAQDINTDPGAFFAQHVQSGQKTNISENYGPFSGVDLLAVWHTIQPATVPMDKSLVIGVSRDVSSLFAPWHRDVMVNGGLFFLLAFVSSLGLLLSQGRQRAYNRLVVLREAERSKAEAQLIKAKSEVEEVNIELKFLSEDLEQQVKLRTAELVETLKARNQLSQSVEQSPSIMFITNTEGVIEYANAKFYEVTGYSPQEIIGQTPRILKSGNTPPSVYKDLWSTIQLGNIWQGEIEDQRKNGQSFWADVTITPIRSEDGTITHYSSSHIDITERKEAELKMREARDQAVVAYRAKSDLMANMSHELRTPLNAIIGFSSTILEGVFGPIGHEKYREYLGDIHQSGEHLLGLINDILDVSAMEAGAVELYEENVTLADVVDTSVRIIGPRANTGQVSVMSTVSSELPQVYVDERRLKQILLNLLSNAVKFTHSGGEVSVSADLNGDGSLSFTVADNGIGMDVQETEKAMSPFGQVDSGLNRKHEGTGLGLPLTVGLVELHGGTLQLKSTKGAGTAVTITIPQERVIQNPS